MGLFALFFILTTTMRLVMISGTYGQILLDIPVVSHPIKDPAFHNFQESPQESLRSSTPTIVMTSESFFFGDLEAFSTSFGDIRSKFVVPHEHGVPQVPRLVKTMDHWLRNRAKSENIPLGKTLVLVPSGEIPLPIIVQVLANLKKSPLFEHVILSTGLI